MKGTKRRRENSRQPGARPRVVTRRRELRHTLYTGEVGRVPVKASKVQRNGSRNDVVRPRSTGQVRRAFDRVQSGFVEPRLLSQPR